jgi:tetratricopeptide (TPR) repeat protein
MARYPEAMEQIESARKFDPLSVRISFDVGVKFWFERQFEMAANQLEQTVPMDPSNSLAYDFLGQILWKLNKSAEAFSAFDKTNTLNGVFNAEEMAEMRKAYETAGLSAYLRKESELMQKRLAQGKYQSALQIALHYAAAGSDSEALDWLEKAAQEHTPWLSELKVDATWDALRLQPRFIALLKRIGLEE